MRCPVFLLFMNKIVENLFHETHLLDTFLIELTEKNEINWENSAKIIVVKLKVQTVCFQHEKKWQIFIKSEHYNWKSLSKK